MSTGSNPQALAESFAEAAALAEAGRLVDALERYSELAAAHPAVPEIQFNRAVVLAQLGRPEDAVAGLHAAGELRPGWAAPPLALGHLLFQQRRYEEAAHQFAAAAERAPDSIEALTNVGVALTTLRRPADALASLQRARELAPANEEVWYALRRALILNGQEADALADFLRFKVGAAPTARLIAVGLASARQLEGEAAEQHYLRLAQEWQYEVGDLDALGSVLGRLQYHDVAREDLLRLYQRYDELMQEARPERMDLAPLPPGVPPLRVGYLSADFRDHVMGRIVHDVLVHHDHERVLPFLYSLAPPGTADALTDSFRERAAGFVDLWPLGEEEGARRIANDELHVLVDLMVHSNWARPGILVHKPAPVIITHLGNHGAIGLRQVDFKLTDARADVADAGAFQLEQPLPMAVPVIPIRRVTAVGEAPARWPDVDIAFGAFANLPKLSPRCLRAWSAILGSVPRSALVFSPFQTWERDMLLRRCASFGIAAAQLRFLPATMNEGRDRARYRVLDIVLDAFPYTGGDSAASALSEGVPFVTRRGVRHAERVAAGLLTQLGVTELIADNDEDYVAIAVRLATDRDYRGDVAAKIRAARPEDLDEAMLPYTRALEDAYAAAWEAHTGVPRS